MKVIMLSLFKWKFNLLIAAVLISNYSLFAQGLFQATGVKVGEVSQSNAIIWVRLTKQAERNVDGTPFKEIKGNRSRKDKTEYIYPEPQIPAGKVLNDMKNSVPGSEGEARVVYWIKGNKNKTLKTTDWKRVNSLHDFTYQFKLSELEPWTSYNFITECRFNEKAPINEEGKIEGQFKTAPEPDSIDPIKFSIITCQAYHQRDDDFNGHKIYNVLNKFTPDFFVMTGDIVYYDRLAPVAVTPELARFKWHRMYSLPFQKKFHKHVSSYFIKDDHDTYMDDCWPTKVHPKMGELTFKKGQEIFLEQVPMNEKTYRTYRWGKDLQIWMVEGRDYRSSNLTPDGPEKTIWGNEQKEWFKRTVRESDATFKILISPTPLVGPDRVKKNDNHSNGGFTYEGNELRRFISQQKNMFVVTGDRHWQYVTVDPQTGVKEFATGSTTDDHAGGFSQDLRQPMHKYLNVVGGFLWGTIERVNGTPVLTFRHYDVDGKVLHEEKMIAE